MAAPFTDSDTTTEELLYIEWTPLATETEIGGSAITSYWLQWDFGLGGDDWYDVQGKNPTNLDTSTTLTSDVNAGTTYRFRVKASNIHGWSSADWSPVAEIKAA